MDGPAAPKGLTCEYLTNPLGLDEPRPRLAWKGSPAPDAYEQGGYHIQVASSLANLNADVGDLWDTGPTPSTTSFQIEYQGTPLDPIQTAHWRVRVWDQTGRKSPWSEPASWEAGLSLAPHWSGARWIGCPAISMASDNPPAVYLRREFHLASKKLKRARLFVSAKGLYRGFLNGARVGDFELTPGWTDYHRRIPYEAYDVTRHLKSGENAIGIVLGDGWYCGHVCWFGRRQYGSLPEALAKLYIEFEDDEPLRLATDDTWRASEGPIRANDLLMGEVQDLRMSLGKWSEAGYDDKKWGPVSTASCGQVPVVGRKCLPVQKIAEIRPMTISKRENGAFLVDMGQNMVGWLRLQAHPGKPAHIRIRHAEILTQDGNLYTENLRKAEQFDQYYINGTNLELLEPTFTFHGFRYAQIEGWPGDLSLDQITGVVLSSISEPTSDFRCGNEMVNQLVRNIRWGQWGNYLEVPTDCPQRDERLGWMGDAQIFAPTAAYNFNIAPFMTKWLQDVRDAQTEDGAFPNVAPQMLQLGDGAPAWADAGVIVPWNLYRFYGDRRILRQSFDSMERFVMMVLEANPDLIWRNRNSHNFADWLNVETPTPPEVLATAYFAHSANLLAKISLELGMRGAFEGYDELFRRIRTAFRKAFVKRSGRIHGDTQTAYVLALRFRLLSKMEAAGAARRLVADLEKRGHLTTGFLGVGHLLPVLTQIGRDDLALKLLLNEEYPSWGYSIRQGATTIWERWDGWTEEKGFQDPGMNSFNHYALGSCGEWIFSRLAGIQPMDDEPGFVRFDLTPYVHRELGWIEAHYDSIVGRIESAWSVEGDRYRWQGVVPPNSRARITLPIAFAEAYEWSGPKPSLEGNELKCEVGSGAYRLDAGLPI